MKRGKKAGSSGSKSSKPSKKRESFYFGKLKKISLKAPEFNMRIAALTP